MLIIYISIFVKMGNSCSSDTDESIKIYYSVSAYIDSQHMDLLSVFSNKINDIAYESRKNDGDIEIASFVEMYFANKQSLIREFVIWQISMLSKEDIFARYLFFENYNKTIMSWRKAWWNPAERSWGAAQRLVKASGNIRHHDQGFPGRACSGITTQAGVPSNEKLWRVGPCHWSLLPPANARSAALRAVGKMPGSSSSQQAAVAPLAPACTSWTSLLQQRWLLCPPLSLQRPQQPSSTE